MCQRCRKSAIKCEEVRCISSSHRHIHDSMDSNGNPKSQSALIADGGSYNISYYAVKTVSMRDR